MNKKAHLICEANKFCKIEWCSHSYPQLKEHFCGDSRCWRFTEDYIMYMVGLNDKQYKTFAMWKFRNKKRAPRSNGFRVSDGINISGISEYQLGVAPGSFTCTTQTAGEVPRESLSASQMYGARNWTTNHTENS